MQTIRQGTLPLFAILCIFLFSLTCSPAASEGTETTIAALNSTMSPQPLKIYEDTIVWQDIDPLSGYGIIRMYDITSGTETRITDGSTHATQPSINGDTVVWTDCGTDTSCSLPSAIYSYDIPSGTSARVSSGSDYFDLLQVSGARIVWENSNSAPGPEYRVFVNGTAPGTETIVSPGGTDQYTPAIDGNLVTWIDYRYSYPDIFVYDFENPGETQITNNTGWTESNPAIYGNTIVWQDNREDPAYYSIFTNGSVPGDEFSLTPGELTTDHRFPAVAGSWVVWTQANTSGNYDLFVNNTNTYAKIPIALDRYSSAFLMPSISYSPTGLRYRIVWEESDDGGATYTIHLYTSGTTQTCPVAGFTNDFAGGAAPVAVQFSDTSSAPPGNPATHWFWDFGDGSNSTARNPSHTYSANGPYDVTLTTGNSLCRNATTVRNSVVAGAPVARFSASATSTVVNAPVTFTDSSLGNPTLWNWSWGDGSWTNGTTRNPQHAYAAPGTYTVTLTATNTYGSTGKSSSVTVLAGANADATTTIAGITTSTSGSRQLFVLNISSLSSYTLSPDSSVLTFDPPAGSGFASVSITTTDAGGFGTAAGNISGNVSAVHLQTQDIVPTGFSAATGGPYCSVNYSVNLSSYPENAGLNTQIWESATGSDATHFNTIARGSGFSGTNGTAYTTRIAKTSFPSGGTATLHMSLNATWVAGKPRGRTGIHVERIDDGGTYGQVLATHYLGHNATANLDYFEADSPNGLSTFGLSALEGSGNLFQMVTLTVSSQIIDSSGGSDTGSGAGTVSASHPAATLEAVASPVGTPDPGNAGKLYFNANGIITQATTLRSNDHYATLTIGEGTQVTFADGTVPGSVTMRGLQASEVPETTDSAAFAGMAYDLGPTGITFSPPVTLTLTNPKTSWGNVYTIRSYNAQTHSWQDLPTTYDSTTNTLTATVPHFCCFALFAQPVASAGPPQAAVQHTPTLPAAAATPVPPAPTAMSTFVGLVLWIAETTPGRIYLVIFAGAVVAIVFFMRRRRPKKDQLG